MNNLRMSKKDRRWPLTVGLLFIVAFLLFSLRNLDPITYPSVYAEDGLWVGDLLSKGFYETGFNSRVFPVVGFIIFYQIAIWFTDFFLRGNLYYLPLIIFLISNLFSASIVAIAVGILRNRLPVWGIAAIVVSILLLPVGTDTNEIYGRILNLGFMFPYLQALLLLPLFFPKRHWLIIVPSLTFSLLSGLTFPVGIGVAGIASTLLILKFLQQQNRRDLIAAVLVGFTALLPLLTLTGQTFSDPGAATMPLKVEAWIEFSVARTILYPLVFWFYGSLNDTGVLILLTLVVIGLITQLWRTKKINSLPIATTGYPLYFFWSVTLLNLVAMLGMRSGLSSIFNNYESTFPDRYFTGLNLLFFTSMLLTACRSKSGQAVAIIITLPLLITAAARFELIKPMMHWHSVPSWTESICKAKSNGPKTYVQIAPEGFSSQLPTRMLTQSLFERCAQLTTPAYSDLPWLAVLMEDSLGKPRSGESIRYEGKIVRRAPQNAGKEDGWFYVSGGKRRWILDSAWLKKQGLNVQDILEINASELAKIEEDDRPITSETGAIPLSSSSTINPAQLYDGQVLRRAPLDGSRQDGWFYVKDGKRRWIADGEWLKTIGLQPRDIRAVPADTLKAIPEDPTPLGISIPETKK